MRSPTRTPTKISLTCEWREHGHAQQSCPLATRDCGTSAPGLGCSTALFQPRWRHPVECSSALSRTSASCIVWIQPNAGSDSYSLALSHALADAEVRRSIRCRAVSCMYTAGHVGCTNTRSPLRPQLAASARDCWHVWMQPDAGSDSLAHALSHGLADAEVRGSDGCRATSGTLLVEIYRRRVFIQPDAGPHNTADLRANAYAKRHANPCPNRCADIGAHSISDLDTHAEVRRSIGCPITFGTGGRFGGAHRHLHRCSLPYRRVMVAMFAFSPTPAPTTSLTSAPTPTPSATPTPVPASMSTPSPTSAPPPRCDDGSRIRARALCFLACESSNVCTQSHALADLHADS